MVEIGLLATIRIVSIVERCTAKEIVLPMEKSTKNVAGTTTSNLSVEVVVMTNMTLADKDQRKAIRAKDFMK